MRTAYHAATAAHKVALETPVLLQTAEITPERKANTSSFAGFPEAETVSANIAGIVGEHDSVKAEFWNAN